MERQKDALDKLWEQSISYNGAINFTLADGKQKDEDFYFYPQGKNPEISVIYMSYWWV